MSVGTLVKQNQSKYGAPWWEQELSTILSEQRVYLLRHLYAFRADHDDLLNEMALALIWQIRNRPSAFPASWFQPDAPENEAERSRLHKLARVILRRRIADLFRKRAKFPNVFASGEGGREVADPNAPSPERQALLAKLLEVTRAILDEISPGDRDLIAFLSSDAGVRDGLSARERQRLHRVRRKLKGEIIRRLGADVAELLRITP